MQSSSASPASVPEPYDALAPYYDLFVGDRGAQTAYLRSLIEAHNPDARSILELACGTGAILRVLGERYSVAGVDLSPAMLAIASTSAPRARLFREDIARVQLDERFDVVLCVHDSINHLETLDKWEAVFDRAAEHLQGDGIFVFDMNTAARLESLVDQAVRKPIDDNCLLEIDIRRIGTGTSSAIATSWTVRLLRSERAQGSDLLTEFVEVAFDARDVARSLRRRFSRVTAHDPERKRPSKQTRRLHFVCRK